MNVLFDLDGTLTDPREGIVGCFRHALVALKAKVPPDALLESCIGPPLRESFAALLGARREADVDRAVALYRERYSSRGLYENRVYPDVEDALGALHAAGARLFVATSKPLLYARQVLDHFALTPHFAGVYGSELDGTRVRKEDLIADLLENERVSGGGAVMVGDRAHDVRGAHANGMRAVGALWGYGSRSELVEAGADALCAAPADLPSAVELTWAAQPARAITSRNPRP